MSRASAVVLPPSVSRAIVRHARRARPLECCGFLVGDHASISFAVPMENAAKSRVRYRIDDRAHIELRRTLRRFEPPLAIRGVYHSHPAGGASPSETDLAEALYPEWVYVIVGLGKARPEIRAFRIRRGRATIAVVSRRRPASRPAMTGR
jgi:proteasome lid subunit RPN8/RPN11